MLRSHVCNPIQSVTRFAGFTLSLARDVLEQRHHHLQGKKKTPEGVGVGWVLGGSRGIGSVGLQQQQGWLESFICFIATSVATMRKLERRYLHNIKR